MAVIYLSSVDGSDVDDGSTWALAKATLAASLTAAGVGGTVYMDNSHAETQNAAMTLTSPGTAASPVRIICVDRTGNPEPPTARATTATVSTGAGGGYNITFAGFAYSYGVTYRSGVGGANSAAILFNSGSPWSWVIENGNLVQASTIATINVLIGVASSTNDANGLMLINSGIQLNNTAQRLITTSKFVWKGGAYTGSAVTALFKPAAAWVSRPQVSGVDFSAVAIGALVDLAIESPSYHEFSNCKIHASTAFATGASPGPFGPEVRAVNCDSADTNYRYYYESYAGTIRQETTIVRTGGASDGTTTFSRKMVSSADTKHYFPLVLDDIVRWNNTTGSSQTATVEIITDNVTLTDAECWLEVEYLGTSGFPLSLLASDQLADPIFGTPANQTTSSETWTTTGLVTPVKQKLAVAFTAQEKGPIRCRVMLAKPSTTVYVCPKLAVA